MGRPYFSLLISAEQSLLFPFLHFADSCVYFFNRNRWRWGSFALSSLEKISPPFLPLRLLTTIRQQGQGSSLPAENFPHVPSNDNAPLSSLRGRGFSQSRPLFFRRFSPFWQGHRLPFFVSLNAHFQFIELSFLPL